MANNLNLNNKALRYALISLHNRGVEMTDFSPVQTKDKKKNEEEQKRVNRLTVALSCMTGHYFNLFTGKIDEAEARKRIETSWEKYQNPAQTSNWDDLAAL